MPGPTAVARARLAEVLAPVARTIWPEVAWTFSGLTNTGLPVEVAWSSRDAAVRWAAEVAPPETSNELRLDIAAAAGGLAIDLAPWKAAQAAGPLSFGAGLAGRSRADGFEAKIYVELPRGPPAGFRGHPLLRISETSWGLAGLYADGAVELYGRAADFDMADLRAAAHGVLGSARLAEAAAELMACRELPKPSGVSLVLDPGGAPQALTWFAFPKAVFRSDAAVSEAIRARSGGASRALYDALAGGPEDRRWRHKMIGVGADAGGRTWLQASLRPT
jgi:hypothetical protein